MRGIKENAVDKSQYIDFASAEVYQILYLSGRVRLVVVHGHQPQLSVLLKWRNKLKVIMPCEVIGDCSR